MTQFQYTFIHRTDLSHLHFICRHDETRSSTTRYNYVREIAILFRILQEDANVQSFLVSRSTSTTGTAATPECLDKQEQRQVSTLPELHEFTLQPLVKAKLLEHVRYTRNIEAIRRTLLFLGLEMTAGYGDIVESSSVEEAAMTFLRRPPGALSHAPSLSVELQKFIIKSDSSHNKSTNAVYLSVMNVFWKVLEKQLAGDVAGVSSSSGFPLIPPLATPEDLRDAFLGNKALKGCYLILRRRRKKCPLSKRCFLMLLVWR